MGNSKAFLTARWRHLIIATYAVDADVLLPFLPKGVRLDVWRGQALVSLLALEFHDVRVRGVPVPFHRAFPDVNFRCYARRDAGNESGVVFLKEIVPRRAVAFVARLAFNERFVARPISSSVEHTGEVLRLTYVWQDGGRPHRLAARVRGAPQPIAPGSLEEFVTERRYGFVARRRGGLLTYAVDRRAWRHWRPTDFEVAADAAILYGERFSGLFEQPPMSVVVAEGSPIAVRKIRP